MQTNLKFNTLHFFSPVTNRTPNNQVHAMISISTGQKTNNNYYIYLKHLLESEGLRWRFARVAHKDGNLYITEGNEYNGYPITVNSTIQSKQLIFDIFDMFMISVPSVKGQKIKVKFTFQKVDDNIYLLKKI